METPTPTITLIITEARDWHIVLNRLTIDQPFSNQIHAVAREHEAEIKARALTAQNGDEIFADYQLSIICIKNA